MSSPVRPVRFTLYEVAALAGVSKSTVSRVLGGKRDVSPSTREKILRIMKEHGYRPSHMARSLAGGCSNLVAVITSGIYGGYYADVLRGIDVVASRHGARMIISVSHGPAEYGALARETLGRGGVDGLIMIAPPLDVFRGTMPAARVPVVLVSARPSRGRNGWWRAHTVTVDNEAATGVAMDRMLGCGRRRIVLLSGADDSHDARARRRAFEAWCAEHPAVEGKVEGPFVTSSAAMAVLMPMLGDGARRPDGVFAHNDDMAIASVKVVRGMGLRVPEDVMVIGCDDEHASEIMGLTTLHMPMVELGEDAAKLVFEPPASGAPVREPRHVLHPMPLRVRST